MFGSPLTDPHIRIILLTNYPYVYSVVAILQCFQMKVKAATERRQGGVSLFHTRVIKRTYTTKGSKPGLDF
jgi:hypothetical protein